MERLVSTVAEAIGMEHEEGLRRLKAEYENGSYAEALDALYTYLINFKQEVLIRQQFELQKDFADKCQAGKIFYYSNVHI